MGLKRYIVDRDGRMDCWATTNMERGGMAFVATGAHLPEMDASTRIVSYPAIVSGRVPAGILMHTVSGYDTTRIPKNEQNQDLVPTNSKVYLLTDGEVITNMIQPSRLSSIVDGVAYVANTGLFTDSVPTTSGSIAVSNLQFKSSASTDGYVKVSVKMA